jgi:hypothetical protein
MWVFLFRRLRVWLILAVGVPLLAWLLGRVGDLIESHRGPNRVSRALQTMRGWVQSFGTGPLARRDREPDRPR